MKILLFGKTGQVGWELNRTLQPLGELFSMQRSDIDFTDPEGLRKIVAETNPDVIVNAVAYTAVDKAESEEDLVSIINGTAPGVLAEECLKHDALLVHFSTDYVFDGRKETAYSELDETSPLNAYGRTKLEGERAIQASGCRHLIFRTSWVYASRGHNFLLTILRLARQREELAIVSDQVGSPTSARLIADTVSHCVKAACDRIHAGVFESGTYHLTASGETSWYGFARQIIEASSEDQRASFVVKNLKAIPSSEYPVQASRPLNSRLDHKKLENDFGLVMPSWLTCLNLCLEETV